ncbi:MAG: aspartate-semialdehyde dehydrogenase [Myxococcota bacterium]|jgi:aspartate-semialdehyde dehydrogenase|nr:aspartate-semialdehyde dehydrogenase [Myxococcota bacterium]
MNPSPIPIAILGATGMVGQRMVALLADHPFLQLAAVCASQRSAGRPYHQATTWRLPGTCPAFARDMEVLPCDPNQLPAGVRLVFSALDSGVAGPLEDAFRAAGYGVVTNASSHREDPDVPLVIPEVNPGHLELLSLQQGPGFIVANPNCSAIPLTMALAPLHRRWGVEAVTCATWQAVSGAGYPGESAWDMVGNVHPHAGNEEEKLAIEPLKILGAPGDPADFAVSARCVRVPVADGHLIGAQVRLTGDPGVDEVAQELASWTPDSPELPSAPRPTLLISDLRDRPSPRMDADNGRGMAVTVGRIEACPVMGVKFFALAHNTIRGAAGAALANAELLALLGKVPP